MSVEISSLAAADLGPLYANGSLSPVDVALASLDRAERCSQLNVFVTPPDRERILAQARQSETRWRDKSAAGSLDGVPITVKDAILTKGLPTLAGSTLVDPHQRWDEDAPAVARLREEKAIILGKTTTPELGWKGVTDSPLTGISRNPWNPELTPGGSSGGSAAAVAAGIGHAAIGTDAAGSVRIPASFCGVVAFKASRGRVPTYPPSTLGILAHVGPICRTVLDASLLIAAISRPDARDWNAVPPDDAFSDWERLELPKRRLRVAFSRTLGHAKVQPEVAGLFDQAVLEFRAIGADLENVEKPFDDPSSFCRTLFEAGVAHAVRRFNPDQRRELDPGLLAMAERGEAVSRRAYMEAVEAGMILGRQMRLFHQTYDLLLTPAAAVEPFAVGRLSPPGYDRDDWLSWAPFAYPFNVTGQPALSVPCGLSPSGLPVGLQIVGNAFADRLVLSAARAYEKIRSVTVPLPASAVPLKQGM
ncbi:MAG TPA: amidase [Xanthobacteraceae bacterium]|jgi:aspartyl-tRNA(Asn)/glutamyl-tRNA(Gln) amidotransferase subunit A